MRARKSVFIGLAGLTGLAVIGAALTAYAATSETMNGNNCQSIYPPDTSLGTGLYHSQNQLGNSSGNWRYVSCPVERVNAQSTAGWNPAVVATDNTNQLWCAAVAMDEWGNILAGTNKTIPAGTGPRLINWPTLTSYWWGYFNVGCTMPNSSSIQQILNTEY